MDTIGRIIKIGTHEAGESSKGKWQKIQVVIETDGKFPKKVAFTAWNDLVDQIRADHKEGDRIKVHFDIESREYQEKWYTDAKAWRIEKDDPNGGWKKAEPAQGSGQQTTISEQPAQQEGQFDDDLPF